MVRAILLAHPPRQIRGSGKAEEVRNQRERKRPLGRQSHAHLFRFNRWLIRAGHPLPVLRSSSIRDRILALCRQ